MIGKGGLLIEVRVVNGGVGSPEEKKNFGQNTSGKSPKPARTDALPSPNGSHAMPMRGAKFLSEGLLCHGSPTVTWPSLTLRRFEILPLTSVGTVANSYRRPRLKVRLLLIL